ncbi:formyltransferase family protein [Deltaproteobacteria bacterium TL4]
MKCDFSSLKCLFLVSSFNGLSQKVWCNLALLFQSSKLMLGLDEKALQAYQPDLILCPYLLDYLPETVWKKTPCFIVHPGPVGDRGPSSLNWAVLEGKAQWGVTILEAKAEWDAGPVWATGSFAMPQASVAHIYRTLVADQVLELLPQAVERYFSKQPSIPQIKGTYRKRIHTQDLFFSWQESTQSILVKIRAGDNHPGTLGMIDHQQYYLYGASQGTLTGKPGSLLDEHWGEICVATGDASIWISRIALPGGVKLRPHTLLALGDAPPHERKEGGPPR